MLLGGQANLCVDDVVGGQVLRAFGGHPHQGLLGLHDRQGVLEALEVELQALAVGTPLKPLGQPLGVGSRKAPIPGLRGQVDDRGRPHAAVQVVVEEHLRRLADRLEIGARSSPSNPLCSLPHGGLGRHDDPPPNEPAILSPCPPMGRIPLGPKAPGATGPLQEAQVLFLPTG